jgi:flavodoxin
MTHRVLVVYYSLGGNTQRVAQAMARELGADELSLQPVRSMPKGFVRYLIGGFAARAGRAWPLQPLAVDPSAYDVLFVGGPTWASAIAPPMRQFLATTPLRARVAVFATAGGSNAQKPLDQMKGLLGANAAIAGRAFAEKGDEQAVADWAKQVVAAL